MIDPPLTRGGKRSQISTITVRNTDTSETNIFWQLFRCISPCQPSGLSPRPECNAAKAEVWFKKVCKHWWWQSCSNNMLCDFVIRRPIYCVFIITIFAMNSFTKRVLQIKQKTPKNRNSASMQCFMGFVFHFHFMQQTTTYQRLITVSVCHAQVIQLIWRDLHLWGQKCKVNGVYDTVNHLACDFAKCSPILKILSPSEWKNDKCVVKKLITP